MWKPQLDIHELTQGLCQGQTPPYAQLALTHALYHLNKCVCNQDDLVQLFVLLSMFTCAQLY